MKGKKEKDIWQRPLIVKSGRYWSLYRAPIKGCALFRNVRTIVNNDTYLTPRSLQDICNSWKNLEIFFLVDEEGLRVRREDSGRMQDPGPLSRNCAASPSCTNDPTGGASRRPAS